MCEPLPNDEEISHTAGMMAKPETEVVRQVEEEEEKERVKGVKQIKNGTDHATQTPSGHELKMAMMRLGECRESRCVHFCKAATCSFIYLFVYFALLSLLADLNDNYHLSSIPRKHGKGQQV